jgi:hypothetical protein
MTDEEVEFELTPYEMSLCYDLAFKDALALVNRVTGNKEGWFIQLGDGPIITPVTTSIR